MTTYYAVYRGRNIDGTWCAGSEIVDASNKRLALEAILHRLYLKRIFVITIAIKRKWWF